MKIIYWQHSGELRSVVLDERGSPIVSYHSPFNLKDLLMQGYVEISERSARALYLPL